MKPRLPWVRQSDSSTGCLPGRFTVLASDIWIGGERLWSLSFKSSSRFSPALGCPVKNSRIRSSPTFERIPVVETAFLGFALGAAALGGLVLLKVAAFGLAGSILAFAVLSVVAYIVLRAIFGLKHGQVKIWDRDINEN